MATKCTRSQSKDHNQIINKFSDGYKAHKSHMRTCLMKTHPRCAMKLQHGTYSASKHWPHLASRASGNHLPWQGARDRRGSSAGHAEALQDADSRALEVEGVEVHAWCTTVQQAPAHLSAQLNAIVLVRVVRVVRK